MKLDQLNMRLPIEVRGYKEVLEGVTILRSHPDALRGIVAVGIQRGGITALTLNGAATWSETHLMIHKIQMLVLLALVWHLRLLELALVLAQLFHHMVF